MSSAKVKPVRDHRPFVLIALLGAALAGSTLGGWMLLGWLGWVTPVGLDVVLRAHGQIQVYGFIALFTMGVAILMLCNPMRVPAQPLWLARLCPALVLVGIVCSVVWPPDHQSFKELGGPILESMAAMSFLTVLWVTRQASVRLNKKRESFNLTQLTIMSAGIGWLMLGPWLALKDPTAALETVLWGFAAQFIMAVGARSHTAILAVRGIYEPLLPVAAGVLNIGLLMRWLVDGAWWAWVLALAATIYLICLRPFRRSERPAPGSTWLRAYVRTSYVWLMVSVILNILSTSWYPELAGASRHALGTGFILTMIVGMAFRMIPAFEVRRVLWAKGPWVIYVVLWGGTVVRVAAQALGQISAMALGGALQLIAIWIFVLLLVGTSLWGEDLTAPDYVRRQQARATAGDK